MRKETTKNKNDGFFPRMNLYFFVYPLLFALPSVCLALSYRFVHLILYEAPFVVVVDCAGQGHIIWLPSLRAFLLLFLLVFTLSFSLLLLLLLSCLVL